MFLCLHNKHWKDKKKKPNEKLFGGYGGEKKYNFSLLYKVLPIEN